MIVDCLGRRAGSAEFRSPVEPLPYLYDAGGESGPAYVCFDESEKRAIHRITTGSDGVKKVEFAYGAWADRATLTYQPVNGVNGKLEVTE